MYAKVTHRVLGGVFDAGLTKRVQIIMDQFKIYNRVNAMVNEPCSACLIRSCPAPQHIGRYHAEIFNTFRAWAGNAWIR